MVVSSPSWEATGLLPVFISTKQPVPYVFFAIPSEKQHWPNRAACWSPAIPAMGISSPNTSALHIPTISLLSTTRGRALWGMPSSLSMVSSQRSLRMSNSMVREALVTSVTKEAPSVREYTSQVSMVPKRSRLFSANSRAAGTFSKIHFILVPEK